MFLGRALSDRGQLPVETTSFVGREAELARLSALLSRARLITVTGPGGVGKTRLALRAAAKAAPGFADGACLAELAAVAEPGQLVPAVAGVLGVARTARGSLLDAVLAHLADRELLLILDTCEHLIDACAMFAEAVVARASRVTMLATSREPLDVSGENACPVAPLPVPRRHDAGTQAGTAVDLFMQRASAAVPGYAFTPDDLPQVIRLCRRLDGIPLAIELAAVRLRGLPIAELASRLDQRLALLTSGRGARHRTLRDAIGWSHDLCTPTEQALWARLSVFGGPFTMSAAEEVCAGDLDSGQVMPALIRLVDKSILVRACQPASASASPTSAPAVPAYWSGGGHPTKYLLPGTFRAFGAAQLAASDSGPGTRRRFVGRYLAMATALHDHFLDDDQFGLLWELRREHDNISAALRCALDGPPAESVLAGSGAAGSGPAGSGAPALAPVVELGVELATALLDYWRCRGLAPEGSHWLGKAVARAPAGSAAQGRALLARGHLLAAQGSADLALADVTRVLDLAADLGDGALSAHGHLVRTMALTTAGRLAEAADAGDEARRLLTALGDRPALIDLDIELTYLALLNGDHQAAFRLVERALRQLGASRERWLHASCYLQTALALYLAGRDAESAWAAGRALQVKQETGDVAGLACALELLGWLAARAGSHQRAAWLLGAAETRWERAGRRFAGLLVFERARADAVALSASALGAERFAELLAKGTRQPLAATIGFALDGTRDPDHHHHHDHDGDGDGDGDGDNHNNGDGAQPSLAGRLTSREREIAVLVADGLTNRQVAEKLFISRRTVDAHLEHIFGKLGITSRVMLAIHAREQIAEPADHISG
jgi:predicted ATPase/DNA-binding CsgD family transcriptional regulator/tetratricopeptide (TPR) repeat protein